MSEASTTKTLSKALVELQAELTPVHKNALNPFFKKNYADLPNIIEMLRPLLQKHGLAMLQIPQLQDGVTGINTTIRHESGEQIESFLPLIVDKQNDPQRQGAAITYARRYSLISVLGIVTDDDEDEAYLPTGSAKAALGLKNPSTSAARPLPSQLATIRRLAKELGYDTETVESRISAIRTGTQADEAIKALKEIQADQQAGEGAS